MHVTVSSPDRLPSERIDGKSVAESDGALALARLDKKDSVRLTIRRDAREIDFVISAPR